MNSSSPKFIADVTLYPTAQGGRRAPTPPNRFGCPCKAAKDDEQSWDCQLLLAGTPLSPGDTRRLEIMFLTPELAVPALRKAPKFFLWELGIIGEAMFI
jgi:hypothetical protein